MKATYSELVRGFDAVESLGKSSVVIPDIKKVEILLRSAQKTEIHVKAFRLKEKQAPDFIEFQSKVDQAKMDKASKEEIDKLALEYNETIKNELQRQKEIAILWNTEIELDIAQIKKEDILPGTMKDISLILQMSIFLN